MEDTGGIFSFGGNFIAGLFNLGSGKIDSQNAADLNAYNRGQSELATQRTQELVAAAVAAAVAVAIAVIIVRKTKKR